LEKAAHESAEAEKRRYHKEFRRDVLKILYSENEVIALMQLQDLLPDKYRPALERAYPMFYLSICSQKYGDAPVGDLLCT
jgi:hypothetical protein